MHPAPPPPPTCQWVMQKGPPAWRGEGGEPRRGGGLDEQAKGPGSVARDPPRAQADRQPTTQRRRPIGSSPTAVGETQALASSGAVGTSGP